jgi:hypothetical protein
MPEIGTSGSMSGDGKRGVAEWPKLPRPSSTLPNATSRSVRSTALFERISCAEPLISSANEESPGFI